MPWQISLHDQSISHAIDFAMQPGEIVVADLFSVHSDAFVNSYEMRRGVQARF